MKLLALALVAGMAGNGWAGVLVDTTTIKVSVDTSTYILEASTKNTKAEILAKFYQAREQEDRNRLLWLNSAGLLLVCQEERALYKAQAIAFDGIFKSTALKAVLCK